MCLLAAGVFTGGAVAAAPAQAASGVAAARPAATPTITRINLARVFGALAVHPKLVNDRGDVAGTVMWPDTEYRAALWTLDGKVRHLHPAGTTRSDVTVLNDQGQALVNAITQTKIEDESEYRFTPWLWSGGRLTSLVPPGETSTEIRGMRMNQRGQVLIRVGVGTGEEGWRFYLWESGRWTRVDPPEAVDRGGMYEGRDWELNDNGQIAMNYRLPEDPEGARRVALWEGGRRTEILRATQQEHGALEEVMLNNRGQVAMDFIGDYPKNDGRIHFWDGERIIVAPMAKPTLYALNERGQVLTERGEGGRYQVASLWDSASGGPGNPPAPPAEFRRDMDVNILGMALNERGQVAGYGKQPWLWENGTLIDLPTIGDPVMVGGHRLADGFNDQGLLVGTSKGDYFYGAFTAGRALLWHGDTLIDLAGDTGERTHGIAVSDNGYVLGSVVNPLVSLPRLSDYPVLWRVRPSARP